MALFNGWQRRQLDTWFSAAPCLPHLHTQRTPIDSQHDNVGCVYCSGSFSVGTRVEFGKSLGVLLCSFAEPLNAPPDAHWAEFDTEEKFYQLSGERIRRYHTQQGRQARQ